MSLSIRSTQRSLNGHLSNWWLPSEAVRRREGQAGNQGLFEDEAAQTRHGQSDAVKRFESIYSPELVGGDVVFTDYELVSGKR